MSDYVELTDNTHLVTTVTNGVSRQLPPWEVIALEFVNRWYPFSGGPRLGEEMS